MNSPFPIAITVREVEARSQEALMNRYVRATEILLRVQERQRRAGSEKQTGGANR
jgi:hypothetical protein